MARNYFQVLSLLAAAAAASSGASADEFFQAIRANDLAALKKLSMEEGAVKQADPRGTTPLHAAAMAGSVEAMKLLLASGADVNARNAMEATPLILAASSAEKIKLLLAAGADAKAQSKAGSTALIIAAGRRGMTSAVQALLEAGAEVNHANERGTTALLAAAGNGDLETVRLLLERGAPSDTADKAGVTPLIAAVGTNEPERIRLFVEKGANVNAVNNFGGAVRHGRIALINMTPLIFASAHAPAEVVRGLLAAGAKVNVQDGRGMTPLMVAVSSDRNNPEVVKALVAAGADVNAEDGKGESVLDWARKAGHPAAIRILEAAGAKGKTLESRVMPVTAETPRTPRAAVEQAVGILERSSAEFFKQSGCVGCHHQPITAQARFAAVSAGIRKQSGIAEEDQKSLLATRPVEPALAQFLDPGGEVITVGTVLQGFAAAGIPASSFTDAAVNYIAGKQSGDGSWTLYGISRAPAGESPITITSIAIKAMRSYGWPARQREFDERIAKAQAWLLKAEPHTSYERADLLLGLRWSGADAATLRRVADRLLREQRANGGWSQNASLEPDAYATGLALHALHESGVIRVQDKRYRKGVDYLLRTQQADGSWYVKSRAPKFQPYFQSGFPYDHDQWISAMATGYAAMALAPAASDGPTVIASR
jgi:ankyrin repeat protein